MLKDAVTPLEAKERESIRLTLQNEGFDLKYCMVCTRGTCAIYDRERMDRFDRERLFNDSWLCGRRWIRVDWFRGTVELMEDLEHARRSIGVPTTQELMENDPR